MQDIEGQDIEGQDIEGVPDAYVVMSGIAVAANALAQTPGCGPWGSR